MGIASLAAVGGVIGVIAYLIFSSLPAAFETLTAEITEAAVRDAYRRLLPRLSRGALRTSLSETEQTALLLLLEIGVVRYENGMFFAETVREKKQIQNAPLYPLLCLE